MDRLDAIFSPESVAVIGASSTPGKVGHDIFENILKGGFKGTLYPVNPSARSVLSVRCYKSIMEIPDPVDLAMIILPPQIAVKTVDDCIEKGVKGIVIVSAGFKEVGGHGAKIEDEIAEKCRNAGIRLIGPNCLGVDQSRGFGPVKRQFFIQDAQQRQYFFYLPERRAVHCRTGFCRGPGVRVFQVRVHRQ